MWNITKTLLGHDDQNVIIKVDPTWGFSEFPEPGDVKKHLLPVLIDPEELASLEQNKGQAEEKSNGKQSKQFWMPDRYCKVCYGCEEPFTMYRRRHHCRMCGQIFCNTCSSYAIDGSIFNSPGLVRACRDCFEQAGEQAVNEMKVSKKRTAGEKASTDQANQLRDLAAEYQEHGKNIQARASVHLSAVVRNLVENSPLLAENKAEWLDIILTLIKVVVSSVDPDVRSGDNIDIRPYVKIKVIPGGTMSECVYVDGVVFRKNVSHKKMALEKSKDSPKILLLAGGIEFQRTEAKLSSMDTLIEQEDKYMEILVEKIMSLKPDIILVGKAVARRAQELLIGHNVIVMQNVKMTVLERVARMTGAMLLPSTDNMIKQYGEECLGSCGNFFLRLVQDDPEKMDPNALVRVLRTRISRASTYAYFQNCPAERGCTIVLRGAHRNVLAEVKRIIRFSVSIAYHLRLEVAFYTDRFADLPSMEDNDDFDDGSDVDDEIVCEKTDLEKVTDTNPVIFQLAKSHPKIKAKRDRLLLSTSLDVDFSLPYRRELIGTTLFRSKNLAKYNVESHQTLLITSLLMGEGNANNNNVSTQKAPADVKGIKYYTKHDIALGQFVLDNCFQFTRGGPKETKMLEQQLSFVHRPGRIDIAVKKVDSKTANNEETLSTATMRDYNQMPLYISSYCKECRKVVCPNRLMSEEVFKMSFGKFLEIMFYNRSARCTVNGCRHSIRDCHVLSIACELYVAVFEFIPTYPYTLNVRNNMEFPQEFYWQNNVSLLTKLPERHAILMEDFRLSIMVLEREIKDLLSSRPEDMSLAMADVHLMESELQASSLVFLEDLLRTFEHLPKKYQDKDAESKILTLIDRIKNPLRVDRSSLPSIQENDDLPADSNQPPSIVPPSDVQYLTAIMNQSEICKTEISPVLAALFPMIHCRDTYLRASRWNTRIDTIYKFLESVRNMLLQQMTNAAQHAANVAGGGPGLAVIMEGEEFDEDYNLHKKQLADVVLEDLNRNAISSPEGFAPSEKISFAQPSSTREDDYSIMTPTVESMALTSTDASGIASLNALYKAAFDQTKKTSDKPVDKVSKITKALSKFLVLGNKDSNFEGNHKFFVPLGEFGTGRYGLPPGRNGVVIPVSEDVYASVIAYSLASNEYYNALQASIREDFSESYDTGDAVENAQQQQMQASGKMAGEDVAGKDRSAEKTPLGDEDNDLENEDQEELSSVQQKGKNYGITKHMKDFSSNDDVSTQHGHQDVSAFGGKNSLFGTGQRAQDGRHEESGAESSIPADEATSPRSPTSDSAPDSTVQSRPPSNNNNAATTAGGEKSSKLHEKKSEKVVDGTAGGDSVNSNEKQLLSQDKSIIRHRFDDYDDRGALSCKFQCQIYYAKQFEAMRNCYFKEDDTMSRDNYIRSLAMTARWSAQGGKSGASFSKTMDERLVIKVISKVELQMFLDFAPAYFEYMAKAYYHNLPTVMCKILGIYTVRYDNKETGKKTHENVVVMENIFYQRNITKTFDLKGSNRTRYVDLLSEMQSFDQTVDKRKRARRLIKERELLKKEVVDGDPELQTREEVDQLDLELASTLKSIPKVSQVLMDDNLMEFTQGKPFPMKHRAKLFFHKAVQNDTLFLSIVNVVDYSIVVGLDENTHEMVVGIIDYLRQYDIIKKMESVGKGTVGMVTGQGGPTIIQPSQYRKRFTTAMDRYFMTVPDKWISYET